MRDKQFQTYLTYRKSDSVSQNKTRANPFSLHGTNYPPAMEPVNMDKPFQYEVLMEHFLE